MLRAGITIPASVMHVNREQPPAVIRTPEGESQPLPISLGLVSHAVNVRCLSDTLRPVRTPELLVSSHYRPFMSDERGYRTNILTQSDTGVIRHSYTVESGVRLDPVQKVIGEESVRIAEGVRVGALNVLRGVDDSLRFINMRSDKSYEYLGPLPAMPKFTVRRVPQPDVTGECPAVKFTRPVEDFRSGVPSEVASLMEKSTREGYRKALLNASRAHVWCGAVAVRIGVRTRDGNLVHLSEPQIILPPQDNTDNSDARFLLTAGSNGYEKTGKGSVSLPAFRVSVSLEGHDTEEALRWSRLFGNIEVWVSQQNDMAATSGAKVSYRQSAGNHTLAVTLDRQDTESIGADLVESGMKKVNALPFGSDSGEIVIERTGGERYVEVARTLSSLIPGYAKGICGYDGFLHLGNVRRRLPDIHIPATGDTEGNGEGSYPCRITVAVRINGTLRHLKHHTLLNSLHLPSILWYGDSRAESMTVCYTSPSGVPFRADFPLRPTNAGEGAYYAHPYGNSIPLSEIAQVMETTAEEGEETLFEENPEEVVTSLKGNPFVMRDRLRSVGGEVRKIVAQPSVIGGYTRQFVYLATDRGMIALVHDSEGNYKNVRGIGTMKPTDEYAIVAARSTVYLISDGTLIQLSDGRQELLLRGLTEYTGLLWYEGADELWLLPADRSCRPLALNMWKVGDVSIEGSLREVRIEKVLDITPTPVVCEASGNKWLLYSLEGEDTPFGNVEWRTHRIRLPFRGVGVLRMEVSGSTTEEMRIEMSATDPFASPGEPDGERDVTLVGASLRHPPYGVVELPYVTTAPSLTPRDAGTFNVTLSGQIRSMSEVGVYEREGRVGMSTPLGRQRKRGGGRKRKQFAVRDS